MVIVTATMSAIPFKVVFTTYTIVRAARTQKKVGIFQHRATKGRQTIRNTINCIGKTNRASKYHHKKYSHKKKSFRDAILRG